MTFFKLKKKTFMLRIFDEYKLRQQLLERISEKEMKMPLFCKFFLLFLLGWLAPANHSTVLFQHCCALKKSV